MATALKRLSATDAEDADAPCVYTRILCQDVGSTVNVFDAVGGLVRVARFSLARSLISGIESEADVPRLRHALAVKSCHLFLYPAVGVRHDQSRIAFRHVIARRQIDIGGDFQSVQPVSDGLYVYCAYFVFSQGIGIDQSPRVAVVALET